MANELTQVETESLDKWEITRPIPSGSKMTPLRVRTILAGIASGAPIQTACTAAGIHKQRFYDWLSWGEERPDSAYAEFAELAERARAASELAHVRIIDKAAREGAWQASAWLLERVYPQTYGQRSRTEISGVDGGPIEVTAMALIAAIRKDNGEADK